MGEAESGTTAIEDERLKVEMSPRLERETKQADSETNATLGGSAKRRRRRKRGKRKWKPYDQMTREEKEAYEDYQARVAAKKQKELWQRGKPGAPFNTNRFLIEDHGTDDEIVFAENNKTEVKRSISLESSFSDDLTTLTTTSSGGEEDDDGGGVALFIQNGEREFDEMYERLHEEKLSNMSREELVKEIIDLERLLALEKERNSEEMKRLQMENEELKTTLNHE